MHERLPAYRPDFAVAEQPGRRHRPERIREGLGVVIGRAEQRLAATVAGAEESAKHYLVRFKACLVRGELSDEVLVSCGGIPELELDRLSYARRGVDGDRPGLLVESPDVADQVITPTKLVAVLVYRKSDEQVALRPLTGLLIRFCQISDNEALRARDLVVARPPPDSASAVSPPQMAPDFRSLSEI